ncbi:ATP-binding protein [Streptomyces coerulescens]|uniref:ATP-binding protein n=1 Tax=Streptomyces coerulescens TaxID=29304 RepID=A0ABW0CXV0_STRCD
MSPHTTHSPQLLDIADPERSRWLELPAQRTSVRIARGFVSKGLTAWRLPVDLCADAVLLVSELVTNAVRHTPSARILCGIGLVANACLRLEVHDHGHATSLPPCEPGPEEESGRGLFLVQAIAGNWGVDRSRLTSGNVVWATLRTSS